MELLQLLAAFFEPQTVEVHFEIVKIYVKEYDAIIIGVDY